LKEFVVVKNVVRQNTKIKKK